MPYPTHLLPTTVVGSYPQPDWLVNRAALDKHGVPRIAAHAIWRIPQPLLEQAQDDGTILAIRDMERAGIDIITDGEIRRESYSNQFARRWKASMRSIPARSGRNRAASRRCRAWSAGSFAAPGGAARRPVSAAPDRRATRSRCLVRSPCRSRRRTNSTGTKRRWRWTTLRRSTRNCATSRQVGSMWCSSTNLGCARRRTRRSATACAPSTGRWRVLPGRPWCIFASAMRMSCTSSQVATRSCRSLPTRRRSRYQSRRPSRRSISASWPNCRARDLARRARPRQRRGGNRRGGRRADPAGLLHVDAERLIPAPDCGMKYLPRERAFGKLRALAAGAAIVRRELAG